MRLLHVNSFDFAEFRDADAPPYAIASHRWQEEEATFQDVQGRRNIDKRGYKKVEDFARYVQERLQSVEWLWIDTCCINKDSAAELSEAINLMFKWYRNAEVCLAFLADVGTVHEDSSFVKSEWFERGWTLQELLAPRTVIFITKTWQVLGNKGASAHAYSGSAIGRGLERDIAMRTGIPESVLHDYNSSARLTVNARFRWMEGRKTTREEDMSYALYGLFGVAPGANYGEQYKGARERLLTAINRQDDRRAQQAAQFRRITDWLSPPDPWTNHETARRLHEDQTGTWLLESKLYQSWKIGVDRNLWVHGKAGCGKTILCSTAVEDIQKQCDQRTNTAYAAFYFSFSDNHKQSIRDLVLSLVVQLGWKEPGLSMLQQAYENPNRSVPGLVDLENVLLASINSYHEVLLIADALDECPEDGDTRQEVLAFLREVSQQAPNLRILATSRELPDIQDLMEDLRAASLSVAEHSVNGDIRKYVTAQMSRDYRLSRLDNETKRRIEETMFTKADGMFRWAYCQLQELKKLKSMKPKFIHEALNSLPSTLDKTYERMLTGIENMLRHDALTLLRWLAYAQSPPSLSELVDAAIVDLENDLVDTHNRGSLEDTLQILSGLVVIIGSEDSSGLESLDSNRVQRIEDDSYANQYEDGRHCVSKETRVRLAHFSVQEYLESTRILQGHAQDFHLQTGPGHRFLAQSCLVYMMHYIESCDKRSSSDDLEGFPLLHYAARAWFYHSSLQHPKYVDREVYLLSSVESIHSWLLVHRPDQDWIQPFATLELVGPSVYYASFLGLGPVVQVLTDAGADVNESGGRHGNALQAASFGGHEKVVQMLIDAGADVNAQGGLNGNALQAASSRGHKKVAQMLIDARAHIDVQGGLYGNTLHAASFGGHEKVVQMLIDAGVDVNAQGGDYGNALQVASSRGYEKVVQMLIDAGADVDAQGGDYGNALHAASSEGHEKVVQMLIDAGADVNDQGGPYGNALLSASKVGHEKVVQILIDAGIDINAQGWLYSNALHAASFGGHEKVVQMLIDAGADVNAQGGD